MEIIETPWTERLVSMNEMEYCCECDEPVNSDPLHDESVTGDEIGPLCRKCHKDLMNEGIIERGAHIKHFHG